MRAHLTVLSALAASLLACSGLETMMEEQIDKAVEQAVEKAIEVEAGAEGDAAVDVEDGNIVVTTPEGTVSVGTGQAPADWPADVPLYPGANVLGSVTGAAAGGGSAVTATTADASAAVLAFYADKMSGWTVQLDAASPGGHMRSYASTDGKRSVQLAVVEAGGQTNVTLSVTAVP